MRCEDQPKTRGHHRVTEGKLKTALSASEKQPAEMEPSVTSKHQPKTRGHQKGTEGKSGHDAGASASDTCYGNVNQAQYVAWYSVVV